MRPFRVYYPCTAAQGRVPLPLLAGLTLSLLTLCTGSVHAQTYTFSDLLDFNGTNGYNPYAGLTIDSQGNLYGTTTFGGANSEGTVFALKPTGNGSYNYSDLLDFNGANGYYPYAGLTIDSQGNLYGTTAYGGTNSEGTIFALKPTGNGSYNYSDLLDFNGTNGYSPYAGLTIDSQGNLYGTTANGGGDGFGTVFALTPAGNGSYNYSDLLDFNYTNGYYPYASLTIDSQGNLYGTTVGGGSNGIGTVFALTPAGNGSYNYSDLLDFNGANGDDPYAGLTIDSQGDLFGTTASSGPGGEGTVFELTPAGNGSYNYSDLLDFNGINGDYPSAGLTIDSQGDLYGTTVGGGAYGAGTVFELTPAGNGSYNYSDLLDFNGIDGYSPYAGLTLDSEGNLYGTTVSGGVDGFGMVFELQRDSSDTPSTPEPGDLAFVAAMIGPMVLLIRNRRHAC